MFSLSANGQESQVMSIFVVTLQFFHQKIYEKARFYFERADEPYLEKWALATDLKWTAESLRSLDPIMSWIHLTQAAHMYESIGKNEPAAECFFELNEYEKAGIDTKLCMYIHIISAN